MTGQPPFGAFPSAFMGLVGPDGTVEHTGDNLTGEGEGDDEQVKVNLAGLAMLFTGMRHFRH